VDYLEILDDSGAGRILAGHIAEVDTSGGPILEIENGKPYMLLLDGKRVLRTIHVQADGSYVLSCKNDDYPDVTIEKKDTRGSLTVLGRVVSFSATALEYEKPKQ